MSIAVEILCFVKTPVTLSPYSLVPHNHSDVDGFTSGNFFSCNLVCIIGMISAVVGVIILVTTIAGVTIGIYKYIHRQETKMANYDANNFKRYAHTYI